LKVIVAGIPQPVAYVIVTVPGIPVVTTPVFTLIEAMAELLLLQVPPKVLLLSVMNEPPEHRLVVPDIAVAGIPITLTTLVELPQAVLKVIVTVPLCSHL
jgi:hypothetical protein